MYRPKETFATPMKLHVPKHTTLKGSTKKVYPEEGLLFMCSFKTYGGTETSSNGIYSVEDTANIETWYRPDITSDCRVSMGNNPKAVYEVIGEPENIEQRNQFLKFKIRRVKGGA